MCSTPPRNFFVRVVEPERERSTTSNTLPFKLGVASTIGSNFVELKRRASSSEGCITRNGAGSTSIVWPIQLSPISVFTICDAIIMVTMRAGCSGARQSMISTANGTVAFDHLPGRELPASAET